ncbi:agmatine deiminase [Marinobacter daqiaonensis]|uniref:Agmatine deiminase n=1 Tax=Marinobacter daqiaonensis TaxID=650891 RepID=A0A1I6H1T4_9GAMM|nr:agmatine deiminase family protein [Marinobacter daqiaonensis]SFR48445.1 agmatine deiminase [Marinobacter daqiaonensis]
MPAEWAPQSAVMLTWPHPGTDWFSRLQEVEPVFLDIARAVLRFEHLLISCEHVFRAEELQRELNAWAGQQQLPGRAHCVPAPANDTWARDHGPIAVSTEDGIRLLDFRFNAWGGKFPWEKDNALNRHLANAGCFGDIPLEAVDFILEGGSLESDGEGTLLVTSECLMTPSRNPDHDRSAIETILGETLGATRVLWLNHGYLAGDDTDSHIDTLARFCNPDHICYVRCDDPEDEHFPALSAMEEELAQFRQADGSPYRLTPLPWPDAIYGEEGERLPATYANFLIINGAVLVPVYGVPQDEAALAIFRDLFPLREIISVPCRPLIEQHGSLHCVTMQLPPGAVNL